MSCTTDCSAPKGGTSNPASCHHAEIVSTCMLDGQTTRQQSGTAVSNLLLLCQALHSMDGLTMKASWPFTGCVPHLHQMWSWSCCPANVYVCAHLCTCLTNGLSCTDMCRLQSCSNQKQADDTQPEFELGVSDEEIEDQL